MCGVSVSMDMTRPRVGWEPFTLTAISVDGPNGFELSSNSVGFDAAEQTIGICLSLGMTCGWMDVSYVGELASGRIGT